MTRFSFKHIHIIAFSIFVSLVFISCVQYVTLYTIDAPEMKMYDNNYFVFESPKLTMHYDFWAEGGIPIIEVINTSSDTLQMDFTKSNFTIREQTFAFAGEDWPKSENDFAEGFVFNAMYGDMPQKITLPPDALFSFQGLPMAFIQQEEKEDGSETRYLYSNSPYKMTQQFIYKPMRDSVYVDTTRIRFYVNQAKSIPAAQLKNYKMDEQLLANKFYLYTYSPFSYEERSIISEILSMLFIK